MTAMRRVRPVWAIVAAASAVVVLASVVGSVATGMADRRWDRRIVQGAYDWDLTVERGGLRVQRVGPIERTELWPGFGGFISLRRPPTASGWWFSISTSEQSAMVIIPLWSVGVSSGAVFLLTFRKVRRPLPCHCSKCDYNLAGLRGEVCPECGQTIASKGAAA